MSELKPCPFCGSKAVTDNSFFYFSIPGVECTVCNAVIVDERGMAEAIEAWNRRVEDG